MSLHVIATGGTISSHWDGSEWSNLDGASLVAEVVAAADGVPIPEVTVTDVASGPSSDLSTEQMVAVARRVRAALEAGAEGVVVTHGTDTMELTAFVCQLLLGASATRRPVVFTGSMRVHSHAQPDGPRNLLDALVVASSAAAVGHDVLVCLEGTLHSARTVRKHTAASVDAFTSSPSQPVGSVREGVVVLDSRPEPVEAAADLAGPVPLVKCYPGVPADDVERLLEGAAGLVVEGFGDLNVPLQLWPVLAGAARRGVAVVVASAVHTPNAGDELRPMGVVGAHGLPAQQARLALMAGLSRGSSVDDAYEYLRRYAHRHDFGERSST